MRAVWIGVAVAAVAALGLLGWFAWKGVQKVSVAMKEAHDRSVAAAAPWPNKHPAYADLDAGVAGAEQAASQFAALAPGSETSGKLPRQGDPAVRDLLDAAFDIRILKDGPLPPFSKFGEVNRWLKADLKIGLLYTFAGTGVTNTDQSEAMAPAEREKMLRRSDENLVTYAPEIGRYMDAEMDILRVEMAMVDREVAAPTVTLPAGAVDKMAAADASMVSTLVELVGDNHVDDEWRRARMPALLALAPDAAVMFSAKDRIDLRQKAVDGASHTFDADLKAKLTRFADAIAPAPAAPGQ